MTALNTLSLKDKVSPEEWQLRIDLAACCTRTHFAQPRPADRGQGAALAWPALLRKLDSMDQSYKT